MTTGLLKKNNNHLLQCNEKSLIKSLICSSSLPDFNLGIHLLVQQSTEHLLRAKNKRTDKLRNAF